MDLHTLAIGSVTAIIVIAVIESLARKYRPKITDESVLARQLYQGGEAITARKRRYLERTYIFAALFTILHVIYFIIASFISVIQLEGASRLNMTLVVYLLVSLATVGLLTRGNWRLIS